MTDSLELEKEQAYFDNAWEWREHARHEATSIPTAGGRHDVKALVKTNRGYAESLAPPESEVAHGQIALEDGEVYYIGKNSIADGDRDLLVINWRSKMGEMYERATPQEPGEVTRKRTFRTRENQIEAFDDLLFSEFADRIGELTELEATGVDDALLEDLDSTRTGSMRDIVRTIQAAQSGLIRHPADSLLVVQGGPGTGKSAVALHRASWLLFNEPDLRPERMLIIGPTETFTNYIKDVLPGLGDTSVPQTSLRQLGPQRSSRRPEPDDTARLKGEERMARLIQRGLKLRVRFAGDEPTLTVGNESRSPAIPRGAVETQLDRLQSASTYTSGRQGMRSWIADQARELVSPFKRDTITASAIDAALERVWPQLTPQQFLQQLLGSRDRLQDAAGDDFTAGDITRLHRQTAKNLASETWSDSDVALLDEAQYRIRGLSSDDRYDHIVIDEAQDLSPMQLRSISRRSTNGRMTVVGDIAQSTGPWARDNWDEVIAGLESIAPFVQRQLDYGYRVPREIYQIAENLLPYVAPGLEPLTIVRPAPEAPRFVLDNGDHDLTDEVVEAIEEHAKKGRFIGVVVAPEHKQTIADELTHRGIDFADSDSGSLSSAVNLITATEAKGLEFDAVVVVEPAAIAAIGDRGSRLLYIALTRATKYLTVVHAQAFEPLGLEGAPPLQPAPPKMDEVLRSATAATVPARRADSSADESGVVSPLPKMLARVATDIADEIRESVAPDKWGTLLEEVVRQLDPPPNQ